MVQGHVQQNANHTSATNQMLDNGWNARCGMNGFIVLARSANIDNSWSRERIVSAVFVIQLLLPTHESNIKLSSHRFVLTRVDVCSCKDCSERGLFGAEWLQDTAELQGGRQRSGV